MAAPSIRLLRPDTWKSSFTHFPPHPNPISKSCRSTSKYGRNLLSSPSFIATISVQDTIESHLDSCSKVLIMDTFLPSLWPPLRFFLLHSSHWDPNEIELRSCHFSAQISLVASLLIQNRNQNPHHGLWDATWSGCYLLDLNSYNSPYSFLPSQVCWPPVTSSDMSRTFRDFGISLLLFLIKLLEDTVHPNKGVNQEIGRYTIQETGTVTQERAEGNSQVKGDSKMTPVHQREGSQSCLEQTRESKRDYSILFLLLNTWCVWIYWEI